VTTLNILDAIAPQNYKSFPHQNKFFLDLWAIASLTQQKDLIQLWRGNYKTDGFSILNAVNHAAGHYQSLKGNQQQFFIKLWTIPTEAQRVQLTTDWRSVTSSSILVDVKGSDRESLIAAIKEQCKKLQVTLKSQIAYILATAEHESDSFNTMEEYASGAAYDTGELAIELGNTPEADGDGQLYKGRGLVQITGKANYERFTSILKGRGVAIDLVADPWSAARPDIAVFTLVFGLKNGIFTGRELEDYVNNFQADFYNARRVVNGIDRADHIAAIARDWLNYL